MSASTDRASIPLTPAAAAASVPQGKDLTGTSLDVARDSFNRLLSTEMKTELYAILATVGEDSGAASFKYTALLLTSMSIVPQERAQIDETFENSIIYFSDKAPEIYRFAGNLVNEQVDSPADGGKFNWRDAFLISYEFRFRGTKCVENKERLFIDLDDLVIVGYMMGAPVTQNSQERAPSFSFDVFVTDVRFKNTGFGNVRRIGG